MAIDVLYFDTQRLELLQGQRTGLGIRKSVSTDLEDTHSSSVGASDELSGGLTGLLNSKKQGSEHVEQTRGSSKSETFDPTWADAVAFVAESSENLLSVGADLPAIGTLGTVSGTLMVSDLGLVKRLLETKSFQRLVKPPKNQKQTKIANTSVDQADMLIDLLSQLPHSVHCTIRGELYDFWCTLNETHLIVPPDEIILKFGNSIPGTWKALVIVDAVPDQNDWTTASVASEQADFLTKGLRAIIDALGPMTRLLLGRPAEAVGITPLMIYRDVNQ